MKLPDERKDSAQRLAGWLTLLGIETRDDEVKRTGRRVALLLALSLSVAIILVPGLMGSRYPTSDQLLGTFAATNYKADRDYELPDRSTTERLRQDAAEAIAPVYDLDRGLAHQRADSVRKAFALLNRAARGGTQDGGMLEDGGGAPAVAYAEVASKFASRLRHQHDAFERLLGVPVDSSLYDKLMGAALDPTVGDILATIVQQVLQHGVVDDRSTLVDQDRTALRLREPEAAATREKLKPVAEIDDLISARQKIEQALRHRLGDRPQPLQQALITIASLALRPNLSFNPDLTHQRRAEAAASVRPVTIKVRRGEMILRDGDPFQSRHLAIFRGMQEAQRTQRRSLFVVGMTLSVLVLILAVAFFARRGLRRLEVFDKDLVVLSLVIVVEVALCTGWNALVPTVAERFSGLPLSAIRALAPVAFGPMLIGFVLAPELTVLATVVIASLCGMAMENSLVFVIYTLIGGLVAAARVMRARQRTTLAKAGLLTGVASAMASLVLSMSVAPPSSVSDVLAHLAFGMSSGLMASLLVAGLVPVIEALFGYVSDIKLLELANLNHPLLRDLIVQAPGTYHHSIIIGSLVEGGAEAIGANPLLARVMAYYHDIGKVKNPRYFAENQREGGNPHDRLAPSMSALILKSHVKDGLELARQHKIPDLISAAIVEHHGNNLMVFFFEKAKKSESAEVQVVNEVDYRYAGRRPQSRETALLMIGDVVEAASRSVVEPTPDRLMGLVQKSINRLFADGSLDQSQLTLKDLHEIARAFHRVLLGIYHERPAYQAPATKERRSDTKESKREAGGRSTDTPSPEPGRGKESHRGAKGGRSGNGFKSADATERQGRQEDAPENLKRLGSEP